MLSFSAKITFASLLCLRCRTADSEVMATHTTQLLDAMEDGYGSTAESTEKSRLGLGGGSIALSKPAAEYE